MGSIVIKLNPEKLTHPDADLRYLIPDTIEELTFGKVKDNGFDYLDDKVSSMLIYLSSDNPKENIFSVLEIINTQTFKGNQISGRAEIFLSDKTDEELAACNDDLSVYVRVDT